MDTEYAHPSGEEQWYCKCGTANLLIREKCRSCGKSKFAQFSATSLAIAEDCAMIADKWPHRKGYSVADEIRKTYGLTTPPNRPIDRWRNNK